MTREAGGEAEAAGASGGAGGFVADAAAYEAAGACLS
jgi:hypothetical protein